MEWKGLIVASVCASALALGTTAASAAPVVTNYGQCQRYFQAIGNGNPNAGTEGSIVQLADGSVHGSIKPFLAGLTPFQDARGCGPDGNP